MRELTDTPSTIISVRNARVTYHKKTGFLRSKPFEAIRDVSFDLYKGESLGVIGRNGSGKSTLLKVLAGIIKPDKGTVTNNGYRVQLLSLQVGFEPNLSGRVNAMLGGMLLGMSKQEIAAKVPEIAKFSELGEFFDNPLSSYSSGMRARLGFSVAFQVNPDVLLVDEVLGVGDEAFQKKSKAEMEKLIASAKTIVLVSHNVDTIRRLCNRVVWIEHGVTQMEGEVGEVLHQYARYLRTKR